jgi:hypothetical protein
MQYILEILDEGGTALTDWIYSDTPIPSPNVGERLMHSETARLIVLRRDFYYVKSGDEDAKIKITLTCRTET